MKQSEHRFGGGNAVRQTVTNPDSRYLMKEGEKMNNTELLEKKIAESGKKRCYLAEKVGLSYAGFRNCVINKAEFKASQIDILCEELNITNLKEKQSIFFAKVGA